MQHYLGTPRRPKPFGGRSKEIAGLNAWVTGKRASPAMLVAAPAGRGKSALLVRWINQLETGFHKVFVPISIRFETNLAPLFYQALAGRLADILGEKLPSAPSEPAQYYREKVIEYFDRISRDAIPTLVVIDGLDEATGWRFDPDIFPLDPPATLKILVSARVLAGDRGPKNWLQRLGWSRSRGFADVIEPRPLGRSGIAEVLESMGCPLDGLATDVDVIGELHRLTERGDPLLLEFYVSDLWAMGEDASRLRPEDLKKLEPGFSAYFKQWLDDQGGLWREHARLDPKVMEYILLIFSCAMGPLKFVELEALLFAVMNERPLISLKTLEPLQRFVVGDGSDAGYALSHPKLSEYLREDHFNNGSHVKAADLAFNDWCQQVAKNLNASTMKPDAAPSYPLLYYTQHLNTYSGPDLVPRYRELLEDGWRKGWLALEDGEQGFARDVAACLDALQTYADTDPARLLEPEVGLGGQLRALLCLTSINSIGIGIHSELLVELYKQGSISPRQVLTLARHQHDYAKAEIFAELGAELPEELASEAYGLLSEVPETTKGFRYLEALLTVALRLPKHHKTRAMLSLEKILIEEPDDYFVTYRLEKFTDQLPDGFVDHVQKQQKEKAQDRSRDQDAQEPVATQPPPSAEPEIRSAETKKIEDDAWQFRHDIEQQDAANDDLTTRFLDFTAENSNNERVLWYFGKLVPTIVQQTGQKYTDRMVEIAKTIDPPKPFYELNFFEALLPVVPQSMQLKILDYASERFESYELRKLFDVAKSVIPVEVIASQYIGRGAKEGPKAIFELTKKIPWALPESELRFLFDNFREFSSYDRTTILEQVGPHLSEPLQKIAIENIGEFDSAWDIGNSLNKLVPHLSDENLVTVANMAHALPEMRDRGKVLASLIPLYRARGLDGKIEDAQRLAFTIGQEDLGNLAALSLTWNAKDLPAETISRLVHEQRDKTVLQNGIFEIFAASLVISTLPEADRAIALEQSIDKTRRIDQFENKILGTMLIAALKPAPDRKDMIDEMIEKFEIEIKENPDNDLVVILPFLYPFSTEDQRARLKTLRAEYEQSDHEDPNEESVRRWLEFGLMEPADHTAERLNDFLRLEVEGMDEKHDRDAWLMLRILAMLVFSKLSPSETADAARTLWTEVRQTKIERQNAMQLAMLIPLMDKTDLPVAFSEFIKASQELSRPDVLNLFLVLNGAFFKYLEPLKTAEQMQQGTSALHRLGGDHAITEVRQAIRDVASWWP